MSLIRYYSKLKLMDDLIRKKATGNQQTFCKRISMSRSLLNNYINEMKLLGFPIEYDRGRSSYYYKEKGRLVNSLFDRELSESDTKLIKGGTSAKFDISLGWLVTT
jgi:hypothetical protein